MSNQKQKNNNPSLSPILLIDGDSIPFVIASYVSRNNLSLKECLLLVDNYMKKRIFQVYPNSEYLLYLSNPNDNVNTNFRKADDSTYKAHRSSERRLFYSEARDYLISKYRAYLVSKSVEVDDVISVISNLMDRDNIDHVIVSVDKDLMQCKGSVYNTRLKKLVKEEVYYLNGSSNDGYWIKYNKSTIPTGDRLIYYQMLVGDSADNIKGVPGIGPKTCYKYFITKDLDEIIWFVKTKYLQYYKEEASKIYNDTLSKLCLIQSHKDITKYPETIAPNEL